MEVYLYKARGKGGSIYDMTLNPYIDFEVLRKIRGISNIEILTDRISISKAEDIINNIYSGNILGKFISLHDFYINRVLKKYGIKRETRFITSGKPLPKIHELELVEEYIKGKVIPYKYLKSLDEIKTLDEELIIDIIQTLYCERRIKYIQATKETNNKNICFMCNKEKCDVCNFEHQEDDILLYAADNYNNLQVPHIEIEVNRSSQATVNTTKEVLEFVKSKRENGMLLVSPKAFSMDVLVEGIYEILKNGGRVLYITSPKLTNEIKNEILKRIMGVRVEIVLGRKAKLPNCEIAITSYSDYPCFYKSFDFVILDKRGSILEMENYLDINDNVFRRAKKERGKFLKINVAMYDSDKKDYKDIVLMPVDGVKKPIPEPMYITSRYLDGYEIFIPQIAMDFIQFTINKKNNIIIFIPNENYLHKIYYILTNDMGIEKEFIDISSTKDKDGLFRFMKGESKILISSDFSDAYLSYENTNALVMLSDSSVYTPEILVYICQIASNFQGKKIGEVYLVSCQESKNMQIAKSTIRILNKAAWDRGYFKK